MSATATDRREYPCPECSDHIPYERLQTLHPISHLDDRLIPEPGFMEYVWKHTAQQMVAMMLEKELITFETGPLDPREGTRSIRGTLGVVAPRTVASFEQRVKARQTEIAHRAAAIAATAIKVWGSSHGGKQVPKDIAIRDIQDAVRKAIDEFAS